MTALRNPRNGLRLLTLVSLGLNLFLGAMLFSAYRRPPPQPMPDRLVERIAPELPEREAKALRSAFDAQRPRYEKLMAEYRTAREQVRSMAGAEPIDLPGLGASIAETRAKRGQIGALTEETVLSVLPDLSPESRARLVRRGF